MPGAGLRRTSPAAPGASSVPLSLPCHSECFISFIQRRFLDIVVIQIGPLALRRVFRPCLWLCDGEGQYRHTKQLGHSESVEPVIAATEWLASGPSWT